jgi:hypothetical protein
MNILVGAEGKHNKLSGCPVCYLDSRPASPENKATVTCSLLVVRVLPAERDHGDLPDVFYRAAHLN